MEKYLDAVYQPKERADDLLKRMTLEEKVEQLCCYLVTDPTADRDVHVGAVGVINGGESPKEISDMIENYQTKIMEASRLHIPAIFHTESLAGPIHKGCASFGLPIGSAATFSEENVTDMARVIRKQLRAMGISQTLSPVLDLARDFRYGRIAETYGGDPTLVSRMGTAFVCELQSGKAGEQVAATAKHFLGCAQPEAGINQTRAVVDERELEEVIAKPFEAVINDANLMAVMNSYGEVNGEPFCASEKYLRTLLRDKMGFQGGTVSDYHSLDRIIAPYKLAESKKDAAAAVLKAGMDIEFPSKFLYPVLQEAVHEGLISEKLVDEAVYRILILKFRLGLFEHPYPEYKEECFDNKESIRVAKRSAYQSMTLLKNDGILPMKSKKIKIGIIGQPADSLRHMFGAYTMAGTLEMLLDMASDRDAIGMAGVRTEVKGDAKKITLEDMNEILQNQYPYAKTLVEALKEPFHDVSYEKGFSVENGKSVKADEWNSALKLADESELVIVCVGGKNGVGRTCTSGAGIDAARVELPGDQEKLVQELYQHNPNMIVVHTDGRPLVSPFIYENARAVIEAWLPGEWGGIALADVISGNYNPSGRLPVDIPRSTGQMPIYFSQRNGSNIESIRECTGDFIVNKDGYMDEIRKAQRPFGYGLSYTEFEYSQMLLAVGTDGSYEIQISIQNKGKVFGADVVQLYGRDEYASVARPRKELLGFCRVELEPEEKALIIFRGNLSQFAFEDKQGNWVVERGKFLFVIGHNSDDTALMKEYVLENSMKVERTRRCFCAVATQEGRSGDDTYERTI